MVASTCREDLLRFDARHLGGRFMMPSTGRAKPALRALLLLVVAVILFVPTAHAATGPVITSFGASEYPNNLWVFTGKVSDPNPSSCWVHFGGLPSLNGQTTQCEADGSFMWSVELKPGEGGTATAIAIDGKGLQSPVDWTDVNPY
jgi:hypothetical protein